MFNVSATFAGGLIPLTTLQYKQWSQKSRSHFASWYILLVTQSEPRCTPRPWCTTPLIHLLCRCTLRSTPVVQFSQVYVLLFAHVSLMRWTMGVLLGLPPVYLCSPWVGIGSRLGVDLLSLSYWQCANISGSKLCNVWCVSWQLDWVFGIMLRW